jgi:hypothetical protein
VQTCKRAESSNNNFSNSGADSLELIFLSPRERITRSLDFIPAAIKELPLKKNIVGSLNL